MLPDFKATVVLATWDWSRAAALASAIGPVSKGEICLPGLWDKPKLETHNFSDPALDGETFQQNARLSSLHYASQIGQPVLSENYGLVVNALNGEPGTQSHCYGYPDAVTWRERAALVVGKMKGIRDRRAALCLALCLAVPGRFDTLHWEGCLTGEIARKVNSKGYAYDSIFYIKELGKTLDELHPYEKEEYSCWRKCVEALRSDYPKIREFLGIN
jgi:XTP/dITP diphosphohydrolase